MEVAMTLIAGFVTLYPTIRRADLGERTAALAQQMCLSLKAAGGQCAVQRN
jgi:hypothetical protein